VTWFAPLRLRNEHPAFANALERFSNLAEWPAAGEHERRLVSYLRAAASFLLLCPTVEWGIDHADDPQLRHIAIEVLQENARRTAARPRGIWESDLPRRAMDQQLRRAIPAWAAVPQGRRRTDVPAWWAKYAQAYLSPRRST